MSVFAVIFFTYLGLFKGNNVCVRYFFLILDNMLLPLDFVPILSLTKNKLWDGFFKVTNARTFSSWECPI